MRFNARFFTPTPIDTAAAPKRQKQGVSQRICHASAAISTTPNSTRTEQGQPAPLRRLPARSIAAAGCLAADFIFLSAVLPDALLNVRLKLRMASPVDKSRADTITPNVPQGNRSGFTFSIRMPKRTPLCIFNRVDRFWYFRVMCPNIFRKRVRKTVSVQTFLEQFKHRVNLTFQLYVHVPLRWFPRHIFPYIVHMFCTVVKLLY